MPDPAKQAIFVSYAREDTEPARRIVDTLRGHGIEVWFDQSELVGGDAWDRKIRSQIKACSLFMPIISTHTQARREGYFRLEWKLAAQRTHTIADGTPFLLPIAVDATEEAGALVPEEFSSVQWTRLAGGEAPAAFCERIQKLLAAEGGADVAPAGAGPKPRSDISEVRKADAHASHKRSVPSWVWAAVAAAVVAGVILFRPHPDSTASDTKSESPGAQSTTPAATDKSIAVIPFVNRSADRENEFFTDGIHEDILTNLAHIRELRVVSRTSVMDYRGTTKKIPQIARELNVAYILEGSVQRSGNKVRVTGQLIRAATDEHLWAESYDRDLSDVFTIQSELAQKIAVALQATLSPAEQQLIRNRPTQNAAAYDAYLRGRGVPPHRIQGTTLQAQEAEFRRAVELDPDFALAWAELAGVHARFYSGTVDRTPERLAKADAAMSRALALAPEKPEILRLLGRYAAEAHNDFPRAIAALEKFTAGQPHDATGWAELANVESRQGNWDAALAHLRQASQLDSASVAITAQLSRSLSLVRRWDESIAMQRRVLAMRPDDTEARRALALLAFHSGGDTRPMNAFFAGLSPQQANSPDMLFARKEWDFIHGDLQHFLQLDRVFPIHPDLLTLEDHPYRVPYAAMSAFVYLATGDTAGGRTRLGNAAEQSRATIARDPNAPAPWTGLALSEAILGRRESAVAAARRAVEASTATEGTGKANGVWLLNAAMAIAWAGDKDQALVYLGQALASPAGNLFTAGPQTVHVLRASPLFQPLKGDPRFEALLNDPKNNAPLF